MSVDFTILVLLINSLCGHNRNFHISYFIFFHINYYIFDLNNIGLYMILYLGKFYNMKAILQTWNNFM